MALLDDLDGTAAAAAARAAVSWLAASLKVPSVWRSNADALNTCIA